MYILSFFHGNLGKLISRSDSGSVIHPFGGRSSSVHCSLDDSNSIDLIKSPLTVSKPKLEIWMSNIQISVLKFDILQFPYTIIRVSTCIQKKCRILGGRYPSISSDMWPNMKIKRRSVYSVRHIAPSKHITPVGFYHGTYLCSWTYEMKTLRDRIDFSDRAENVYYIYIMNSTRSLETIKRAFASLKNDTKIIPASSPQ